VRRALVGDNRPSAVVNGAAIWWSFQFWDDLITAAALFCMHHAMKKLSKRKNSERMLDCATCRFPDNVGSFGGRDCAKSEDDKRKRRGSGGKAARSHCNYDL
jgi:hypothetical protein